MAIYICKHVTFSECILSYTRHTLRKGYIGEIAASIKSPVSNTRYPFGKGDVGDTAATFESRFPNTCHILWDYGGRTCRNQGVAACLYDSIASVARIVCCIAFFHNEGIEAVAMGKRRLPNTRNSLILFCSFVTLYDLCTRIKKRN